MAPRAAHASTKCERGAITHGAPYEAIEARVDEMRVSREERSALWSLAASLASGTHDPTQIDGVSARG